MSSEAIAIASKSIYEKSDDVESLTDEKLQSLYNSHPDPDLKRVIAQVLSRRGNNTLLDDQIREQKTRLESDQGSDRQEALYQLAKTRTVKAAEIIVPLLLDPDENVKIDALVALRATGNETHISKVEGLLNDADPMVRSLASDVINNLKNLSASARTRLSNSDIEEELPPMENL
jgi:HEAT repeat protein